jgi:methyl-accepting chemotaxis protein
MATVLWRRKQLFVQRGLQLRFVRFVILYMLLCCVVTATIVFYATFALLGEKLAGIYPQHRLPEIFGQVYLVFFLSLLAVTPVLLYGALVFSHRIAGPLPKIYQALEDIGRGNFDVRLTLRKHDELAELAERINRMVSRLKERETPK